MKLPTTRTRIQARYSDTDAMGHFSSATYFTFMEVGRLDFFGKLVEQTGCDPSTVIAHMSIDILRESRYGDDMEVLTWCSRVGAKSLTINAEIHANGQLVATGHVVSVGFDATSRQSTALPKGWQVSDGPQHE